MLTTIPQGIIQNQSLKAFNTFGMEESARFFTRVSNPTQLLAALDFSNQAKIPFLILGGGSNILFTKPYPGLVIHIENKGIEILEDGQDNVGVRVAAGENWHEWVMLSLKKGWFGLENLSLIPGSVGAAPMQNIGAYGVEVKHFILSVEYWDLAEGKFKSISSEECAFGYRESIFKHELKQKAIIWSVDFQLRKKPTPKTEYGDIQKILNEKGVVNPTPLDISDAVIQIRKSKLPDPAELGNAGSFFKNPVVESQTFEKLRSSYPDVPFFSSGEGLVKIPAGWLIEKAGWKGKKMGNYGVHSKQALVLVNYGGASGNKIFELSQEIQTDVKKKFGISLQTEVNLV